MYRLRSVQRGAEVGEIGGRGVLIGDPLLNPSAGHAEQAVGVAAERLLIEEVAPAADALSQQEPDAHDVQQGEELHLADLCHQKAHQQTADDAAVNGKPAAANVENAFPVAGVIAPVQQHVVGTGTHHAADDAADDAVQHAVRIQPVLFHLGECVDHCQHQSQRDENAVPLNVQPADRKGGAVDVEIDAQLRENDLVVVQCPDCFSCHMFSAPLDYSAGVMTDRLMRRTSTSSRRKRLQSSSVISDSTCMGSYSPQPAM